MALRNKDGTPYRLSSPNPVMRTQVLWGSEKFILHNMKWSGETYQDKMQPESPPPDKHSFMSELQSTKPEEPRREQPAETPRAAKVEVRSDPQRVEAETRPEIEKIFIHLLPATTRTKVDELYGDIKKTVYYGEPTSFEAVELEHQDFTYRIWTELDIGLESILFPKTNNKRWWKVKSKERKASGWVVSAMPSDYQPSFPS